MKHSIGRCSTDEDKASIHIGTFGGSGAFAGGTGDDEGAISQCTR